MSTVFKEIATIHKIDHTTILFQNKSKTSSVDPQGGEMDPAETKVPLMAHQRRFSAVMDEEPPFGVHLEKINTDRGTI